MLSASELGDALQGMPPPATTTVLSAKASYKKLNGVLELKNGLHLLWTQDGKTAPAVKVPCTECASELS